MDLNKHVRLQFPWCKTCASPAPHHAAFRPGGGILGYPGARDLENLHSYGLGGRMPSFIQICFPKGRKFEVDVRWAFFPFTVPEEEVLPLITAWLAGAGRAWYAAQRKALKVSRRRVSGLAALLLCTVAMQHHRSDGEAYIVHVLKYHSFTFLCDVKNCLT